MFRSPRRAATPTRTRWYRRTALILTGLAAVSGVTLAGAPAASAATVSNGQSYRITTALSGLAVDVEFGSTDNDARVVQYPVSLGSASQAWQVLQGPGFGYQLRNANSGKCLTVYNNSTEAGAKLVQHDCHGFADQLWLLSDVGGGFLIQSLRSYQAVDVPGGTIFWNTWLQQWPGSVTAGNQLFFLTPVNIAAG